MYEIGKYWRSRPWMSGHNQAGKVELTSLSRSGTIKHTHYCLSIMLYKYNIPLEVVFRGFKIFFSLFLHIYPIFFSKK